MSYRATDNDLPDFLFTGELPKPTAHHDPTLRAETALRLHYPGVEEKRGAKKRERAIRADWRAQAQASDSARRIWIRSNKRREMFVWLHALSAQGCESRMNGWEQRFFRDLAAKFDCWYPHVRWVTERQYQCLRVLALRLLDLPAGTRAA